MARASNARARSAARRRRRRDSSPRVAGGSWTRASLCGDHPPLAGAAHLRTRRPDLCRVPPHRRRSGGRRPFSSTTCSATSRSPRRWSRTSTNRTRAATSGRCATCCSPPSRSSVSTSIRPRGALLRSEPPHRRRAGVLHRDGARRRPRPPRRLGELCGQRRCSSAGRHDCDAPRHSAADRRTPAASSCHRPWHRGCFMRRCASPSSPSPPSPLPSPSPHWPGRERCRCRRVPDQSSRDAARRPGLGDPGRAGAVFASDSRSAVAGATSRCAGTRTTRARSSSTRRTLDPDGREPQRDLRGHHVHGGRGRLPGMGRGGVPQGLVDDVSSMRVPRQPRQPGRVRWPSRLEGDIRGLRLRGQLAGVGWRAAGHRDGHRRSGRADIRRCQFRDNQSGTRNAQLGWGGALSIADSDVTIADSVVERNRAVFAPAASRYSATAGARPPR